MKKKSPQQQLWPMLSQSQQQICRQVFRRLKKRDQEDLCYALIAYIRYGMKRPFECLFMQVLLESFIELINKHNNVKTENV